MTVPTLAASQLMIHTLLWPWWWDALHYWGMFSIAGGRALSFRPMKNSNTHTSLLLGINLSTQLLEHSERGRIAEIKITSESQTAAQRPQNMCDQWVAFQEKRKADKIQAC